jgi:hypothetical protein
MFRLGPIELAFIFFIIFFLGAKHLVPNSDSTERTLTGSFVLSLGLLIFLFVIAELWLLP